VSKFSIQELRELYDADKIHSEHVTELALQLFDQLSPIYQFASQDRELLRAAALLHDIGYATGQVTEHPWKSRQLVLEKGLAGYEQWQVKLIGLLCLYHSFVEPGLAQLEFRQLSSIDRNRIRRSAALLKLADGLDRRHQGQVTGISCKIDERAVLCILSCNGEAEPEINRACQRAVLFKQTFGREITFKLAEKG